jgi:hypothetical protein
MAAHMRTLWFAATMTFICVAGRAAQPAGALYDRDPEHLWNRLYHAIAVRSEGGVDYGVDNSEPYFDAFGDPQQLIATLDEFLDKHGEDQAPDTLRRALLLNDVWAAFDLAASPVVEMGPERPSLRRHLASVLGRLRIPASQISGLPDNYAQAVKSAAFATDFDPAHPERAFLPPDLLDPKGQWVEIGEDGLGAVAPFHVEMLSGRSFFRVFIRCPGGREATLSYLETLNLYPAPWTLNPQDIGRRSPDHAQVRLRPLLVNPATPQFPAGTIVALVRQMMVINGEMKPVPSPITQKVQFRVFKEVGEPGRVSDRGEFSTHQLVYEFVMRRRDILAGRVGGLHSVTQDESEYQLTTLPMGGSREAHLRGVVVLSTCVRCHSPNGIFSVGTYGFSFHAPIVADNPQLQPATSVGYQGNATAVWKTSQFNWGLLTGLIEADAQAEPAH